MTLIISVITLMQLNDVNFASSLAMLNYLRMFISRNFILWSIFFDQYTLKSCRFLCEITRNTENYKVGTQLI